MLAARLRSFALALLFLAPAPALAEGPAMAPGIEKRDLALEKAKEGLALYRAERWQDAWDRFREAEELYHAPSVVLYLARCQRKLGRLAEARALFEQLLAEPLSKDAPPPFIDAHRAAAHELGEVQGEIAAAQRGPASPAPTPAPLMAETRGSLLPGGLALGLGVVGVGVGAITGALSLSKASELTLEVCPKYNCSPALQGKADTAKMLGNVSTAAFILGGAAVAAGVVLLVIRPGGGPKPAASGGVSRAESQDRFRADVGLGWLDLRVRF